MMRATEITRAWTRSHQVVSPGRNADKHDRGVVLVIGGSRSVPGAAILAGMGALRTGAGVLQFAVPTRIAIPVGLAMPESLVASMPRRQGAAPKQARDADAVVVGCGMSAAAASGRLVRSLVKALHADATLVVDAAAIDVLREDPEILLPLGGRAVITPHAGEMASVLDLEKEEIEREPRRVAQHAAERFQCVVALKGPETWIASPGGALYRYRGGGIGLGTSGSGDVLAGVVAGFAARGCSAEMGAAWGVWAHGEAGRRLARRVGRMGFMAREIADAVRAS